MKRLLLLSAVALLSACDVKPASPPEAAVVVADSAATPRGINLALAGQQTVVVPLVTAVSQTDVNAFSFKPGFNFRIVSVQVYARTEAGVVTANVKIGTTSALSAAVAFATATRTDATLATTAAARGGGAAAIVNVHYTSDGTGALTNGFVVVTIQPT